MVELIVAMGLALLLLGMAFSFFNQLYNTSDLAGTMADVNQNLRAAVNLIARDLTTAGAEIPMGGIPLPGGGSGTAVATAVKMPGPGAGTFNPGAGGYMAVITPGSGLGPTSGSGGTAIPTDAIIMISVNPISLLDQYPLKAISYTATSATITVDPGTNIASGVSRVAKGQLIMLENSSACLLAVTDFSTTTNTITFTKGDATNDPLGLNQFPTINGPTTGTIAQLPPTASQTTAYHLNMTTYYLDTSTPQRLMRQVGTGTPQPVALGINILQFSYDVYSNTGQVTPNQRTGINPNQIREVNLWTIAEADHKNRGTGRYYSNSIATSVVIQNLAYYNKY
jgi:hypothetical protein